MRVLSEQKLLPVILLVSILGYVLFELSHVLLPFALAAAIAYCLNPLVAVLEMRGIRRQRAVMIVYIALACLFVTFAFLGASAAIQSASNFGMELPAYVAKVRAVADRNITLAEQSPWLAQSQVSAWMRQQIGPGMHTWMLSLLQRMPSLFSVHVLPLFEMTLLIPFLVFFFMLDGPSFLERLIDFVPARHVEMTLNILVEINYSLGNYLRGIMIQACFMGFLAGIGYWLMGLHYAVYIAIWVALTSVIPYLGPVSAAVAGGTVALFQWGTVGGLFKVLAVYACIRFLDDWLLQPYILRRAVDIHPLFLVFTLMAGASLGGFWGLFFGVPVACMVKVLIQVSWQWYQEEYGTRQAAPHNAAQMPVI
jgi:predicted PurR-regulated permease PerM